MLQHNLVDDGGEVDGQARDRVSILAGGITVPDLRVSLRVGGPLGGRAAKRQVCMGVRAVNREYNSTHRVKRARRAPSVASPCDSSRPFATLPFRALPALPLPNEAVRVQCNIAISRASCLGEGEVSSITHGSAGVFNAVKYFVNAAVRPFGTRLSAWWLVDWAGPQLAHTHSPQMSSIPSPKDPIQSHV